MSIIGDKRFCYYIVPSVVDPNGNGFIPCLVVEGERGYRPMSGQGEHSAPWVWGPTLDHALLACDVANERLGLSSDDVNRIVASSILAARS